MTALQQAGADRGAEEAAGPGDEHFHVGELTRSTEWFRAVSGVSSRR
jgi:hypothetical protein